MLPLYSTVEAAVCRAVGGDLVAAIPQRAPGAWLGSTSLVPRPRVRVELCDDAESAPNGC